MVQVTGKSLSSLTSMSFPLSGGNLSQFYCIHTPKLLKPNNQPVNQPVEKIYFSQLTAVHRASLSPTSSLDNILFTVDGSAASLLPRLPGWTPNPCFTPPCMKTLQKGFASLPLLFWVRLSDQYSLCISTQYLSRALLPGLSHPTTCKS